MQVSEGLHRTGRLGCCVFCHCGVSVEVRQTHPWKRNQKQKEEELKHLSECAVGKMSASAKLEIAKRDLASEMERNWRLFLCRAKSMGKEKSIMKS